MSNTRLRLISEEDKCSCKGYNLDKLIQPQILIVLAKQDLHGYSIIQELENNGFVLGEKVDKTGVYRALKTLEDKGMVHFEWVLDEPGPAKKKYMITEKGVECLNNWVQTLENYKELLEKIIMSAKNVLGEGV